jgi:GT2 family glycosyltransferase
MKYPKVFVIVLNYNGKKYLKKCLNSVYKLNYPNLEVVVIDNASDDDSFEEARKRFSLFHFIKNSRNLGFAAGNNIAIRYALEKMADYVFLLNNDAVIEKNSLKNLVKKAEKNNGQGLWSPMIYEGVSDSVWFEGGKVVWSKMKTLHKKLTKKTDYITGCAMLVGKDVFKRIGLLDEDYFLYYEDADFSWRAKKAGFLLEIVPETRVFHFEKSSENSNKIYWLVLSGLIFFDKNTPWFWRPWMWVCRVIRRINNRKNLKKKKNYSFTIKKAFDDFYKKINKFRSK